MKKNKVICLILVLMLLMTGCSSAKDGADEPVTITVEPIEDDAATEETADSNTGTGITADSDSITDELALSAIENYCCSMNPDLKEMIDSGDQTVYWEIESSDDEQIVVLYRSYTAAEVRYYIDRTSGDTYVTEFVKGITPEEERTDESFNIKDWK
ncbi:MAG: hypothetical protein K6G12_00595 [Lachnospiraceae bacterium]|nr:hypothetical protein [Lachnospiraceae bacterium]